MKGTRRRTCLKATGAIGVAIGTAGCLSWIGLGGDDESQEDQDQGQAPSVEDGEPPTKNDTKEPSTEENATEDAEKDTETAEENLSEELPEASNPEPADNRPNESAYAGNESQASEPTKSDIEVTSHELTTDSSGATVSVTVRNDWHDTITVLDLRVVFKEGGKEVASSVWGTNNLAPGDEWSDDFRAEGEEYSSVDDYAVFIEHIQ